MPDNVVDNILIDTPKPGATSRAGVRSWKTVLSGVMLGLAACAFLAVAALGLLRYVIAPHIPDYKSQIEAQASKALGAQVRIAELKVSWAGWSPVIDAGGVEVLTPKGEPSLKLAQVHTQASWKSLLQGALVFERLELGGPDLIIRRLANGKLQIAGLEIDPLNKNGDGSLNRWLVEQGRITIRGGTVQWIDQLRNAPPARLSKADIDLTNSGLNHAIKLNGELSTAADPAGKPAALEATASFNHPVVSVLTGGDKSDVSQWAGEVFVALSRASLSEIRRYVDIPFAIERGDGSLRAWLNVDKGVATQATADVALTKVKVQLAKDLPWLDLESLNGRLITKPELIAQGGLDMAAEQLTWQEVGRKPVPPANIALQVKKDKDAEKGEGRFTASQLDLGELQHLAGFVKLPVEASKALVQHAPKGLLSDVQASWKGAAQTPKEFDIKAKLKDISLEAVNAAALPGPPRPTPEFNPGAPGFKGVSGTVHATQKGGEADLRLERGSVQLPGIMDPEVIALDKLVAKVNWLQETASTKEAKDVPVWRVDTAITELTNVHAAGNAKITWRQDPAAVIAKQKAVASGAAVAGYLDHPHPGWLDLQGSLTRADAKAAWRYLPVSIPPSVRTYLQNALVQGSVKDAQFTINGDLYQFPFALDTPDKDKTSAPAPPAAKIAALDWRAPAVKANETFRITVNAQDLTLDYVPASTNAEGKAVPGWPAIKNLSGELTFDRLSMFIKDAQGTITPSDTSGPVKLVKVNGRIPDIRNRTTLELQGNTQGALQDYLAFVRNTPINLWTSKVLDQAKATGSTQLDLKLTLPFAEMKSASVEGKLALSGNDLQVASFMPRFSGAEGLITFTEKGFNVKPMKAKFLGGEATIEGGTQEDRSTLFTASGVVTAEAMKQEASLSALSVVAGRVTGQTPYDAKVLIRAGQPEISVSTPLTGMALDFPAPLGKTADTALPVTYTTQLLGKIEQAATSPDGLHDMLKITIGSDIAIQYERELKKTDKGVELKVLRGGIGVNNPANMPDEGVFANIKMPRFDVDAWSATLRRLPGNTKAAAATPSADASAPQTDPKVAEAEPALTTSEMLQNPYIPGIVALQVDELVAVKKLWTNVVAGASFREGQWQANVDSTAFSGYIAWRPGISVGSSLGKVTARLGRLNVPKNSRDIELLLDEPPDQLPAIDMVVEDFVLGGKSVGRVELDALNVAGTSAGATSSREWQLRRLAVSNPESTLIATGNWMPVTTASATGPSLKAASSTSKRVSMSFALEIKDSGALLTRFGIPKTIKDGAGRIEGKLSWTGSPTAPDFPTLGGAITMKMEKGQFLKQDPGIARLLGVLSLQTLPRRISLDFRDVFSEGFVFDEATAEVSVERGIARTNNFRMKGTQASVLMEGSADISRETQNLYVIVEPDINLGTASLAYIAINPAIGLTTFFLQWLARNSLNKALAFEYRVTGPWVNPKVEKVDSRNKVKTPNENAPQEIGAATPQ